MLDKDSLKLCLENNFASIENVFISIDKISKENILKQIETKNFNAFLHIKEQYLEFKSLLGKTPKLTDFLEYEHLLSPTIFISNSKSYIEFQQKVEKLNLLNQMCENENFLKAVRFLENSLPIKRVYEFYLQSNILSVCIFLSF